MRRKWGILALTAMLALSGCTNVDTTGTYEPGATSAYETENMKLSTNIMVVGEEEVTLNEMLFYFYQVKAAYDGKLTVGVWNFQWGEEKTIGSYAKEDVLNEITQIKVICQQAKKEGCALTEEETNEAIVNADQYVSELPEEAKEYHLFKELVEKVYKEHALAKKMYDVVAGTVDTTISAEEADTTESKEKVILERETAAFSKAYQGWKKNYKVQVSSTLLDQIPFDR